MKSIANILHNKSFPLRFRDDQGNTIYFESLSGFWWRSVYDDKTEICCENSCGYIKDNENNWTNITS